MNRDKREETLASIRWELETCGHLTEAQADRLMLMVTEYFADHWRDDDSPQAERTLGVRKAA